MADSMNQNTAIAKMRGVAQLWAGNSLNYMFQNWKQSTWNKQSHQAAEAAHNDIARLLHDKAMLMRMVRELGLQVVESTRDMAALSSQGDVLHAVLEDKKLLCEELIYCEVSSYPVLLLIFGWHSLSSAAWSWFHFTYGMSV